MVSRRRWQYQHWHGSVGQGSSIPWENPSSCRTLPAWLGPRGEDQHPISLRESSGVSQLSQDLLTKGKGWPCKGCPCSDHPARHCPLGCSYGSFYFRHCLKQYRWGAAHSQSKIEWLELLICTCTTGQHALPELYASCPSFLSSSWKQPGAVEFVEMWHQLPPEFCWTWWTGKLSFPVEPEILMAEIKLQNFSACLCQYNTLYWA